MTPKSDSNRAARWAALVDYLGAMAPSVEFVGNLAHERGEQAWLVGGLVRDFLLGREVRDLDVVVVGDGVGLTKEVARQHGGSAVIHPSFGTAHWSPPGIDIATARTETYPTMGALPKVTAGDLQQDLYRRDFTINMMAIGLSPGERGVLMDPYSGQSDLAAGLLRVVHEKSFFDDPTRAWRAARFAERFGVAVEPQTQQWLDKAKDARAMDAITDERLGAEIRRVWMEPNPGSVWALAQQWGLLDRVVPCLSSDENLAARLASVVSVWREVSKRFDATTLDCQEACWLAVGLALTDVQRGDRQRLLAGHKGWGQRWMSGPGRIVTAVERLSKSTSCGDYGDALMGLTLPEIIVVLSQLKDEQPVWWWLEEGRLIELSIDGHRLMASGLAPGPQLATALSAARRIAWNGGNTQAQLAAAIAASKSD